MSVLCRVTQRSFQAGLNCVEVLKVREAVSVFVLLQYLSVSSVFVFLPPAAAFSLVMTAQCFY